ncbi:MAG TPA: MBL fold metallo-hydrolase [Brevundimonas sp.]|uniref:MBL fold metallo-hydrolase n=1 Tax=Brevundimonas sp. TaxID=1871086 RepID=UPI002DF55288|nr:MBL fold metallo-hydrolase [Brevundimonas sp.]
MIPFVREFDARHGEEVRLTPLVSRVTAANPGPFTFTGTNSFIVGRAEGGSGVAVIDPGPGDPRHLEALLKALAGRRVSAVLLTHTHRDHAPLAHPLANAVGAPVLAAPAPHRETHASTPDEDETADVRPDRLLSDGDRVEGDGWTLRALATPGHASNHLCFELVEENALFSGDHVMGWSTTVVAPPDGDMTDYMGSLETVIGRAFDRLLPAHGAQIDDPAPFLAAYRDHRLSRDVQILERLAAGDRTIAGMVPALYAAVDPRLWPAASLSVWAHLIALERAGRVAATPGPTLDAVYAPA